jgi:hypothetical protein
MSAWCIPGCSVDVSTSLLPLMGQEGHAVQCFSATMQGVPRSSWFCQIPRRMELSKRVETSSRWNCLGAELMSGCEDGMSAVESSKTT